MLDSRTYDTGTEYDQLGRIKRKIYPAGYYTQYQDDTYSNLTEVTEQQGRSLWTFLIENARGQITRIRKGGDRKVQYNYDA